MERSQARPSAHRHVACTSRHVPAGSASCSTGYSSRVASSVTPSSARPWKWRLRILTTPPCWRRTFLATHSSLRGDSETSGDARLLALTGFVSPSPLCVTQTIARPFCASYERADCGPPLPTARLTRCRIAMHRQSILCVPGVLVIIASLGTSVSSRVCLCVRSTSPARQLRKFGVSAYLDEVIVAPSVIKAYLCETAKINSVLIGDERTQVEALFNESRSTCVFTNDTQFLAKRSKYSGEFRRTCPPGLLHLCSPSSC